MTRNSSPLPLVLTAVLSGCIFPSGLCVNETRGVVINAVLEAAPGTPGNTGTASLSLYEARPDKGAPSAEQSVLFGANSTLDRTTVTAVHLHAGTPTTPGRILYPFPLVAAGAPSNITIVYTREPYQGALAFPELFALMAKTATYIDVHVAGAIVPILVGASQASTVDWSRANCS